MGVGALSPVVVGAQALVGDGEGWLGEAGSLTLTAGEMEMMRVGSGVKLTCFSARSVGVATGLVALSC